jgi:hypothetical protein
MKSDGKQLEALVAHVERTLLPQGFEVKTNERVFNDEGIQIAEFDIEIRGKLGSTNIAWLIECRDRPGHGPAPGSWIEQLFGRRARFGFNKVTAVSTTGFAAGAVDFARREGIELREVKSLKPEDFGDWLQLRHIRRVERVADLKHASINCRESESAEVTTSLAQLLSRQPGHEKILRSSTSGEVVSAAQAFLHAVSSVGTLFDDVEYNGTAKDIEFEVRYSDDDHYIVDTPHGPARIATIVFTGELRINERLVPLDLTAEYRKTECGELISQVAAFAPQSALDTMFAIELHRMAESGETHVILRKVHGGT